jgi:putative transposase
MAWRYAVACPGDILLDNGPEGTGKAMFDRSERPRVRLRFAEPGKPVRNAFVESFNGKFRDDCLNLHWFRPLRPAREDIGRWRHHNNTARPRSALGYLSPTEFLTKPPRRRPRPSQSPRCRSTPNPNRKTLKHPRPDRRGGTR